jgi:hypothetical protein
VRMTMKTILIMTKKKKKSTEESENKTDNIQWLVWKLRSVRIPRRVVQRHSEASGQQQQLEADGVSTDNWIPATWPTKTTWLWGDSGSVSLLLTVLRGNSGMINLNSETEFELKLTLKLENAI